DFHVTGVQTCALPIWEGYLDRRRAADRAVQSKGAACGGYPARQPGETVSGTGFGAADAVVGDGEVDLRVREVSTSSTNGYAHLQIGRASCRERVWYRG